MKASSWRKRRTGLTLFEFLFAIAILSVSLTLATTSFAAVRDNLRLQSTVNYLIHLIHQARHSALSRGVDVALCPSQNGQQCGLAANWQGGWLMFVNHDGDMPPRVDPGETVLSTGMRISGLQIHSNRPAFILRPHGKRSTNGTLTLCDRRGASHARAVIVSYTGKPRASQRSASGRALDCPQR